MDFVALWRDLRARTRAVTVAPMLGELSSPQPRTRVFAVTFTALDVMRIGGWLTQPRDEPVEQGVVVGHSYGGREEPDFHLPFRRAVLIFSCARGISRCACADIPSNPDDHVLHGIERRETYVHMVVARPIRCGAPPRRCWSCSSSTAPETLYKNGPKLKVLSYLGASRSISLA